jgi:AcrR family transcriptional regulator
MTIEGDWSCERISRFREFFLTQLTMFTIVNSSFMNTDRRTKYRAAVRTEILEAARSIFVSDGYEKFSMRVLAARMGYTAAATYKHFKNKAEIFSELADDSFAALMESSSKVKDIKNEDPVDRVKRGMRAYVAFGLQNPDHYRIAFLVHQPGETNPPKPRAAYSGLAARVQQCIEMGKFKAGDADAMAQSLWAAAHGITSLLIQKPQFPWVEHHKLISQVIESAVAGLRASAEISQPRSSVMRKGKSKPNTNRPK